MDEIYHKIILVTLNQSYLIINELVLKGTEMGGGGVSQTDLNAVLSSNNGKNANRCLLALQSHYKLWIM